MFNNIDSDIFEKICDMLFAYHNMMISTVGQLNKLYNACYCPNFGVPLNRQTVHLQTGDVLFVCEANSKTGGRLPSGTEFLEQMGDGFYFRFLKIEIL